MSEESENKDSNNTEENSSVEPASEQDNQEIDLDDLDGTEENAQKESNILSEEETQKREELKKAKKERLLHSRILVVDDNKPILGVLNLIFTKVGFKNVKMCSSGEEAWKHIQSGDYELLITDLNLRKGMTGMDLISEIRVSSDPSINEIKVMVISATDDDYDLRRMNQFKVDAFIKKPFEGKIFYQNIKKLINKGFVYDDDSDSDLDGEIDIDFDDNGNSEESN